jgi:hypothetical protein
MEAREWIIKGGLYVYDRPGGPPGNQAMNHVDGLVLGFNEHVLVREVLPDTVMITREEFKAAYQKAMFLHMQKFEEGKKPRVRDFVELVLFGPVDQKEKK